MMIPETNSRREWEQSEEWRAQKAEGERRKWEWEKVSRLPSITRDGNTMTAMKGAHQLPSVEEVDRFWATGEGDFTLYPLDQEGLAQELKDLDRDAALMAKHEGVDYGL